MGTVLAVVSGKGGTGKTTTAAAVASCLAALGHRTLCIDCDAGLKNLDIALGMTDCAVTDLMDVVTGRTPLKDAVYPHMTIKDLFFLPAPVSVLPEQIDADGFRETVAQAREEYEYTVIDAPAGVGAGFRLAAAAADTVIVVSNGDLLSMRDGQCVVQELLKLDCQDVRMIVNRVKRRRFRSSRMTVDDIIDTVGARLLGLVSEDEDVILAANRETPLILCSDGEAANQFLRIARRIAGEDVPLGRIKNRR